MIDQLPVPAGQALELGGIAALWLALLVRVPDALRRRDMRSFWATCSGIAAAMALHTDLSCALLRELSGDPQVVHVLRNSVAVAASCLVLHNFTAYLRFPLRKSLPIGFGAVVASALLFTDLRAVGFWSRPVAEGVLGSYWSGFLPLHFAADLTAGLLCVRAVRSGGPPPFRLGMSAYAAGFLLGAGVGIPLAGVGAAVGDPGLREFGPVVSGLQACCLAIGVGAPLLSAVCADLRKRRGLHAIYPLWMDMIRAVPEVNRTEVRSRIRALLRSPSAVGTLRYRLIIEIRDAVLVLSHYCSPELAAAARAHAAERASRTGRPEAVVLACWLRRAVLERAGGGPACGAGSALPGGDDLDEEERFLLEVAEVYRSGPALRFALGRAPQAVVAPGR
ncbi:hypothetical protein INP57_20915 [Saccharopolyspora sp. HNM0986]|uniref:MAB_1171c family putative transporter n=1 Tax=Saccharopolyspora galaxeae TaxID=2781241 RepID=UPI00190A1700|nr:MAB_1171c family putative transporter [Saccharopolyspora sp. HNM0986]MBK0869277.1 hypothetical protein [Saccharopolyspora sp. HNM0986]